MEMESKKAGNQDVDVRRANPLKTWFPLLVVVAALVVAFSVFYGIFADASNFENNDPIKGHPKNFFGTIYKGGMIIPVGLSLMLIVITVGIERLITIMMAKGRASVDVFAQKVRMSLDSRDFEGAIAECDAQRGSVASVMKSGLKKYRELEKDKESDREQKRAALQQALEEATTLELPSLERNLPFIATIASLGVLVGLLGTVIGMIKAFQALGAGGAPDAASLSVGISEALVNTAIGIFTSSLAIILYNFFTTNIDGLTYRIDEAGYTLVQDFEAHH